ncbi:hypothetical protein GQ600_14549 [Phytophthora cactorum]|nr:hypothetical protein GQ600_14549 [Phytophthora cactorum]
MGKRPGQCFGECRPSSKTTSSTGCSQLLDTPSEGYTRRRIYWLMPGAWCPSKR